MRSIKALLSRLTAAETPGQAVSGFKLPEIQLLIDKADQRYYRIGQSELMPDAHYDVLRPALKELAPEDPRVTRVGVPYSPDELRTKVPHTIPMGSIDNTDDGILGYDDWYQKTCRALGVEETKVVASLKVDGGSLRLRYEKGQLVEAVTRGNGEVGEDITANAVNFKGIPTVLPKAIDLDVRGEAVLYVADYQGIRSRDLGRPFSDIPEADQSNPRNIGNGIFGRDNGQDSERLHFIAFNVHNGKDLVTEQGKFEFLREMGFQPVPHRVCSTTEEITQFYSNTADNRDGLPFEIDGVVVCLNDLDQQQHFVTDDVKSVMRPKYARAIKFPHKANTTVLLDVDLTVGHSGAIIPTAILEEVRIGGVNVTHALLNNWDEIERLGVAIGDTVEVVLAGDIIPKIIRVVSAASNRVEITEPDQCPSCGEPTTRTRRGKSGGAVTYCTGTKCSETQLQRIDHWIGSSKKGTGILGIGDGILRTMWDEQVIQDAADLYTLKASDLEALELSGGGVIGNSRATKIVANIAGKRQLPLHIFLGSLGIELFGRRRVQILAKTAAGELDTLSDWMDDAKLASIQLEGFGDSIREAIRHGMIENRPLIDKLIANGVTIDELDSTPKTESDGGKFAGLTFCFTGTRALTTETVELGGELTSSVAKTKPRPDFLVQLDSLSTSNKSKNAESNGHTQIISLDFLKRVINGEASLTNESVVTTIMAKTTETILAVELTE